MSPLLKIPIVIQNNEQKEKLTQARILPSEISYYYPGFYNGTVVVMKSGSSYLSTLSEEQFDQALHS